MAGWGDRLKGLLGGKPKPAPKKAAPSKTYKPPGNRAAIIAEALAIHRRERAHTQGVLEQALKELQSKPPRPSDLAAMTRLLSLRQAVLSMKAYVGHDLKRYQVLAGVKGLMESGGGKARVPAPGANSKKPPPRGGSQGIKR